MGTRQADVEGHQVGSTSTRADGQIVEHAIPRQCSAFGRCVRRRSGQARRVGNGGDLGGQTSADEEFADEATKTTEHALAVIFAGIRVMDALEGAINPVPDLTMTGIYVQANWVEPLI
jgi:hypothetical protein